MSGMGSLYDRRTPVPLLVPSAFSAISSTYRSSCSFSCRVFLLSLQTQFMNPSSSRTVCLLAPDTPSFHRLLHGTDPLLAMNCPTRGSGYQLASGWHASRDCHEATSSDRLWTLPICGSCSGCDVAETWYQMFDDEQLQSQCDVIYIYIYIYIGRSDGGRQWREQA